MKWNRKTLLAACEELIRRDDFTLKLATIDPKCATAHVEWSWGGEKGAHDFEVTIDASQGGLIESLLHECLHIVVAEQIGDQFNAALEESIIKALERDLWMKAMKTPQVMRWRALINQKLEGSPK